MTILSLTSPDVSKRAFPNVFKRSFSGVTKVRDQVLSKKEPFFKQPSSPCSSL